MPEPSERGAYQPLPREPYPKKGQEYPRGTLIRPAFSAACSRRHKPISLAVPCDELFSHFPKPPGIDGINTVGILTMPALTSASCNARIPLASDPRHGYGNAKVLCATHAMHVRRAICFKYPATKQ